MVRRMLDGAGHHVAEASGGKEGLKHLRCEPVDLVITDILMPDVDGLEIIREVRKAEPAPRIVAITGGGSRGAMHYLEGAVEFGADYALAKPFSKSQLISTIEGLLPGGAVRNMP